MSRHALADPFDQHRLHGIYPALDELVALHRFAGRCSLAARRVSHSPLAGEWRTHQRGRGIDFDQVRAYQAGDDIRAIDWRVTARRQAPHTKLYREERERPVLLAADLRSPMFFGSRVCYKSVQACAVATLLSWIALAGRDRVGGVVFGDDQHYDIRPQRSRHSVLALIQQLQQFASRLTTPCPITPAAPLSQLLDKLLPTAHTGAALFILSDFHDLDQRCEQRLFQLARHNDLTLIQVRDPLEMNLPQDRSLWVSDGQRRVNLQDLPPLLQQQQQRDDALRQLCQRLGLPLHSIATDDSPVARVQQLYGRTRNPRTGGRA
ncbi:DUF58 domain-containing protein [Motiliproteus sediminis]|uniref:DUF58 domain-containing protein n=1 Tax=Motiliproteus sediminis TaxID=1468178 RepID=UPI001AEFBA76|nr:DUF58 domain-containing protein [Motiliproteus sediminis]